MERRDPLLVTRIATAVPVVLALPPDAFEGEVAVPEGLSVIERVRDNLGDAGRDVVGPMLLVPFDVVQIASVRDVDQDVANTPAALAELEEFSTALAWRYRGFLQDIGDTALDRRLELGLNHLRTVQSAAGLRQMLVEFPELKTDRALKALSAWVASATTTEERLLAQSQLDLLKLMNNDVDSGAAFASYEEAMKQMWRDTIGPRLAELQVRVETANAERDWETVLDAGDELLGIARVAELHDVELFAASHLVTALYETFGARRATRLERVIALLERMLQLARDDPSTDPIELSQILMNLGAAYGSRLDGDPVMNQQQAIDYHRQALALTSIDADGHGWALLKTNLGLSLLQVAEEREPSELDLTATTTQPDVARLIEQAIGHFMDALRWRSFSRDPGDWAFTEINLGLAYSRRTEGDRRTNLDEAATHAENAARGFSAAGIAHHEAQAFHNLSHLRLELARLDGVDPDLRMSLLIDAEKYARQSLELRPVRSAPIDAGLSWRQLGAAVAAQGKEEEAIAAYRTALDTLTPEVVPRESRDTARHLAELAESRSDWELAAEAWEIASRSAANASGVRATGVGRFDELSKNVNVFRFAAYALTRVGALERAVEVLELGRAHELGIWLQRDVVDIEALRAADPLRCEEFLDLRRQLDQMERAERAGKIIPGRTGAVISEALTAATAGIRSLPGFERFLLPPRFEDVVDAIDLSDALVYVLSAPAGAAAIVIHRDGGKVSARLVDCRELTSTQIFRLLLDADIEQGTVGGYLFAHAQSDEEALNAALVELGELLGPRLLSPIAACLQEMHLAAACFVPVSLFGLLPLHALQWVEGGGTRCLVDDFDIAFAPSAFVRSVCLDRARQRPRLPGHAVIVGNPVPHSSPLEGAQFEAESVSQTLMAEHIELLVGQAATKEAVLEALPRATHVHLACHAGAAVFDEPLAALISLANDEPLFAHEILALSDFAPRLVVASACETGVIQGYESADEALALSTAFIGAGAAGVVASLWAVDDYATSLLMTRFYEVFVSERPEASTVWATTRALRDAQLWLRDLTVDEENAYVEEHPTLDRHRSSSHSRGSRRSGDFDSRPFGSPNLWSSFIFTGA